MLEVSGYPTWSPHSPAARCSEGYILCVSDCGNLLISTAVIYHKSFDSRLLLFVCAQTAMVASDQ